MAKAKRPASHRQPARQVGDRQLIDDSDQLAQAIIRAVGSLKPGESLEIRKVRDPNFKPSTVKTSARKKAVRKPAATGPSQRRTRR